MTRFPVIDYSVHPAFSEFPKSKQDLSSALLPSFVELDSLINEFDGNRKTYNESELSDFYNKTVSHIISLKIKKIIEDEYDFNKDSKLVLLQSIPSLLTKLYDQSVYKNIRKGYKISNLSAKGKKVLDDLKNNGIVTGNIDLDTIAKINQDVAVYKEEVMKMAALNPAGRNAIDIPKRSRHWRLVMKNLNESGFLEGASAFYGSNLFVSGCGLELSTDKQTWWRDCYDDISLATAPCVYMHNDYDYDYVKSLIYLSEVEKDTGPFSYIPESHLWEREQSLSFYIKETEKNLNQLFKDRNQGKSNYYRRAMGIVEGRKVFNDFPKLFQQLSHFGDDILPNSDLNDQLIKSEYQLTSDKGNFAFFTGGTGIHRGSNVKKGHRWAFQITLTKEQTFKKKLTNSTRDIFAGSLKSLVGEKNMLRLQKKFKSTF